jgi:hypothetical protein
MMTFDQFLAELWSAFLEYVPRVAGAVVILLIGWAIGRLLGRGVSRLLERAGIADRLGKTLVGRALTRSGVTSTRFLELLVRWFVYLVAVLAVVDVLQIAPLTAFMTSVVEYLPSFISGIFILLFGLVIADFVGDAVAVIGREAKIEFAPILSLAVKLFLYLTVIIIALATMKIDVTILNEFAKATAWGTAIGISIGLGIAFGLGLRDYVAKNVDKWVASAGTLATRGEDFWAWYTRSKEEKEST